MGWSGRETRCRKHPKHKQSSGVCPSCLRDKLSSLQSSSSSSCSGANCNGSSAASTPYSSDSVSYSSSSCSSSMASPVHCYGGRATVRFSKSRSAAWGCGDGEGKSGGKKGFWSKLLMGSGGGEGKKRRR